MLYDLHVHTTASDGLLAPGDVLNMASDIGLRGIAITDHDTVAGLQEARSHLSTSGLDLQFIPGIEMNTEVEETEVHILGYFINDKHHPLLVRLEQIKEARMDRAQKMVHRLKSMGMSIQFEQVEKLARGDLIGRPHVAQALMEKGYVFSLKEAFDKYIGKGRPAYVPRYKFLPDEAIHMVQQAGGIPVLAHPGLIKDQSLIKQALAMGIKGLEVYYPEHTPEQVNKYLQLSRDHDLLITGGSDFHGSGSDQSRSRLGCAGITEEHYLCLIKENGER